MSPAGRGLLPAEHRQCGDGGQQAVCFPGARQKQRAVEHHARRPGALPPQTWPGPGGQRSAAVVLTYIFVELRVYWINWKVELHGVVHVTVWFSPDPTAPSPGALRRCSDGKYLSECRHKVLLCLLLSFRHMMCRHWSDWVSLFRFLDKELHQWLSKLKHV